MLTDYDFCDYCGFTYYSCKCDLEWAIPESTLTTCQGCGAISNQPINTPHNCWRNEDGSYEEGGTFQ